MTRDMEELRDEIVRYRARYQDFGAIEGAQALGRILTLIDEGYRDMPRPIGEILADLREM